MEQAISNYLNQWWLRFKTPYGFTGPLWNNCWLKFFLSKLAIPGKKGPPLPWEMVTDERPLMIVIIMVLLWLKIELNATKIWWQNPHAYFKLYYFRIFNEWKNFSHIINDWKLEKEPWKYYAKILMDHIICLFVWFNSIIFMPPPLGAGGIMFSGCPSVRPSVRSLKYPLLTCTWVHWSTRPTVTVLQHVRPSVRPSVRRGFRAFAGECMGGLASNFTCWCILTIFRTD